jgi:hypothetical protein
VARVVQTAPGPSVISAPRANSQGLVNTTTVAPPARPSMSRLVSVRFPRRPCRSRTGPAHRNGRHPSPMPIPTPQCPGGEVVNPQFSLHSWPVSAEVPWLVP